MRHFLFFISLLAALATLNGCTSFSEDSPTPTSSFFVGMSGDRVKSRFGEPLRVEHTPLGGEDWYYSFASWGNPDVQGGAYNDGTTSTVSASVTFSDQSGPQQEHPIHLSADGHVIEPLPMGRIVRR